MIDSQEAFEEILERTNNYPVLRAAHCHEGMTASVYEEEDGLETLCTIPEYYPEEVRNRIADEIVQLRDDRALLLDLAVRQQAALNAVSDELSNAEAFGRPVNSNDLIDAVRKELES